MNETLSMFLAWLAGVVLGAVFFGGLHWTVRRGSLSPRAALWFFSSLVIRMSVVLFGFYIVGHGHWERFLLCLTGFLMARFAVIRYTRDQAGKPTKTVTPGGTDAT